MEIKKLYTITIDYPLQYPLLDDPQFSQQLLQKTEFNLSLPVYDPKNEADVEEIVESLSESTIELTPYQLFVRNFMSNYTPYNGLLLFHGLGTGKTCSAITIAEEYRKYLKQIGKTKKIYVLAMTSAIVENFKFQLFHPSHLSLVNKKWKCSSCIGDKFLQEIDPYHSSNMDKETISKLIQTILQQYYVFSGCKSFANSVLKLLHNQEDVHFVLNNSFGDALFIIDEAHNIKEDSKDETFSRVLDLITQHTTIKLLMMTATPIFNSCRDFIYLANILNRNDKRPVIDDPAAIFDEDDNFLLGGEQVLMQHLHGYVSYVKGENPYTFPFRIYPNLKYKHPTQTAVKGNEFYELQHLKIYPVLLSDYQEQVYLENIMQEDALFTKYILASNLLLMTYPNKKAHIDEVMDVNAHMFTCAYKDDHHFFNDLKPYSAKLYSLQENIKKSQGIILIYTRYIKDGIFPVAIALESIGYNNYSGANICTNLQKPLEKGKYVILNPSVQKSTTSIIAVINDRANKQGDQIKVVIITDATSEGVDFKNIRQIHIMDPWWNLNQIEQIIGRAVRLRSHKELDLQFRNTEIFMYTAMLKSSIESFDYYLYRRAEKKAINIGKVTRLLKTIAIDCNLNSVQTQSNAMLNHIKIKQVPSSQEYAKTTIDYPIGDKPYTVLTDYMEKCEYNCISPVEPGSDLSIDYLVSHTETIIQRIVILFIKNYIYSQQEIVNEIQVRVNIPTEQILFALTKMIQDKTPVVDMFNRKGYIINIGKMYMFNPPELGPNIPNYERRIPMAYVHDSIIIDPGKKEIKNVVVEKIINRLLHQYDLAFNSHYDTAKLRGQGPEYLMYSVLDQLNNHMQVNHILGFDKHKEDLVIDSLVEFVPDTECLVLVKYLFSTADLTKFELKLKKYFDKMSFKRSDDIHYALWVHNPKITHRYYTKDWEPAISSQKPILTTLIKDSKLIVKLPLGGIIFEVKGQPQRIFKIALEKRHGAKLVGKSDALQILQKLIPTIYPGNVTFTCVHLNLQIEFCLRFYDKINHEGKRWFLNPIEVVQNTTIDFDLIGRQSKK